jgi:uncharacterized protein with PQ loop repeat
MFWLVLLFVGWLVGFCFAVCDDYHGKQKKQKLTVARPPFFPLHTFYYFITNFPAFIVYTVFCKEFQSHDQQIETSDIFIMIAFQFILMVSFMIFVWYGLLRNVAAPQRVMGLFGCTQKTIAIGIPLINALYENSEDVALYTLPLLVWHPLQLVLGTLIAPTLAAYVVKQQEQAWRRRRRRPHVATTKRRRTTWTMGRRRRHSSAAAGRRRGPRQRPQRQPPKSIHINANGESISMREK